MQKGLKISNERAVLYRTMVAERDSRGMTLRHGGWITMSTAKAINTALKTWGEPGHVYRKKGVMYYEAGHGPVMVGA